MRRQEKMTVEELKERIDNNDVPFLLDIRAEDDYEQGTIEQAVHSEKEEVVDLIREDKLPRDQDILVFCYNGQSSKQIVMVLTLQGYSAYSLKNGIEGWREYNNNE